MEKQVQWRGRKYWLPVDADWDIVKGIKGYTYYHYGVEENVFCDDDKVTVQGPVIFSMDMDFNADALNALVFAAAPDDMAGEFDWCEDNCYPIAVLDAVLVKLEEIITAFQTADWEHIPDYLWRVRYPKQRHRDIKYIPDYLWDKKALVSDEEDEDTKQRLSLRPIVAYQYVRSEKYSESVNPEETLYALIVSDAFQREWETAPEEEQKAFMESTLCIGESLYRQLYELLTAMRKAQPQADAFVIYGI